MSRTPLPPWHSAGSLRAGLPTTRAEWLATVLLWISLGEPDRRACEALGVAPTTWSAWRRWLSAEHAAGRLPEWTGGAWPAPVVGARPGGPLRGAAKARAEARRAREGL